MLMQGITYNTAMAVIAGTIMLLVVVFARIVARENHGDLTGWGWAFIALGSFLGITGLHMTLTWPLKQIDGAFCCKVDNITFGEPAAVYGILTFVAGLAILAAQRKADRTDGEVTATVMFRTLMPLLFVAAIIGFGLVLIGIGGMYFGMWRPPDIEPVARLMAGSLIEPLMVLTLYVGSGLAAILSPFVGENKKLAKVVLVITWCIGMLWIFLGFTVFYSHIGFFPQPDGSYI